MQHFLFSHLKWPLAFNHLWFLLHRSWEFVWRKYPKQIQMTAWINILLSVSNGFLQPVAMLSTMWRNLSQTSMLAIYYEHHWNASVALNWTRCWWKATVPEDTLIIPHLPTGFQNTSLLNSSLCYVISVNGLLAGPNCMVIIIANCSFNLFL